MCGKPVVTQLQILLFVFGGYCVSSAPLEFCAPLLFRLMACPGLVLMHSVFSRGFGFLFSCLGSDGIAKHFEETAPLVYLAAVLKETLRLKTVVPALTFWAKVVVEPVTGGRLQCRFAGLSQLSVYYSYASSANQETLVVFLGVPDYCFQSSVIDVLRQN